MTPQRIVTVARRETLEVLSAGTASGGKQFRGLFRAYLLRRPELLWKASSRRSRRLAHALTAGLVVLYGVAILAANHVPWMSLTLFASTPALYFLAVTLLRNRAGTRQAAEDFS